MWEKYPIHPKLKKEKAFESSSTLIKPFFCILFILFHLCVKIRGAALTIFFFFYISFLPSTTTRINKIKKKWKPWWYRNSVIDAQKCAFFPPGCALISRRIEPHWSWIWQSAVQTPGRGWEGGGREKKRAAVPVLRGLYRIAAFTGRRWDANAHWRILEPAEPKRSVCRPTQGGHSAVSQGSASVNQGEGVIASPPPPAASLSRSLSLSACACPRRTRALRSGLLTHREDSALSTVRVIGLYVDTEPGRRRSMGIL